jgi:hypothetical protein
VYLWNVKAVKRDLIAGALSEAQLFGYFLAVLMFETALWEGLALLPSETAPGLWDYLGLAGGLALTLGGTLLAYRMNGAAGGRNFLGRYFSLMWVLSVRFLVGVIPLMVAAVLLLLAVGGGFSDPEGTEEDVTDIIWAVVVATWMVTALFYWRLAVHMREVARGAPLGS